MDIVPELAVAQIMVPQPVVVAPGSSLQEALQLMNARRVGAVLVVEGERLVGIFTERDLLRHAADAPPGWRLRPVSDWMTPEPKTIGAADSWESAMALMERLHVRHLPVLDDGKLVGILAARDLMARRADHLNRMVHERTQALEERDAALRLHMTVAARLQARLLPETAPVWPEIECHAHYEPLDPLGGDHYDFAQPDPDHLGILIADASGHSIPAAMVAIMACTAFATAARDVLRPGEVLSAINRHLYGLTGEHFVTAFYGLFHRPSRTFTFANAGHPYPYRFVARDRTCAALAAQGVMLGVLPETQYEEQKLVLAQGDKLCLYTDGVVDCLGGQEEHFGAGRLQQFLAAHGTRPARELVQGLAEHLGQFRGGRPPTDDLTILAVDIR